MLSPRKPVFASFRRITVGVTIPRVTLRSTPGYEPLAALGLSTFQVVLQLFSGCAAVIAVTTSKYL